jgi:hypothetical protein
MTFKMHFIVLSFAILFPLTFSATVSLTDQSDYASQRPCAQDCFYEGFTANGGPDLLAEGIGCEPKLITNDCFCRADLQAEADSVIRHCVNSRCASNTLDTNSAVSIYDAYCTSAGFNRAASATTTDAGMPNSPATVTVTAVTTVTANSGEPRLRSPVELVMRIVGLRR